MRPGVFRVAVVALGGAVAVVYKKVIGPWQLAGEPRTKSCSARCPAATSSANQLSLPLERSVSGPAGVSDDAWHFSNQGPVCHWANKPGEARGGGDWTRKLSVSADQVAGCLSHDQLYGLFDETLTVEPGRR